MKELTKAEEQVMQVLWKIEKGFVKDVLAELPDPKPAYNTVSTIIRILEKKEFVSFYAFGKSHQYYPLISKDAYRRFTLNNVLKGYFGGSVERMVSFFVKENKIDINELDNLLNDLEEGSADD